MKKFKLKKEGEGKDCSSLDKKQAWSMLQLGWKKSHTETKTRFLDDRSRKIKHFTTTFSLKTGGRRQKQWKLFQWKEVRTV